MYIKEHMEMSDNPKVLAAKEFLNLFFESSEVNEKKKVKLEYEFNYNFEKENPECIGKLTLKIGIDKMYIVKNIRDLIQAINYNSIIKFGKKFIFNPRIHRFTDNDEKIINFIQEIYLAEKLSFGEIYSNQNSILNKKYLCLNENLFERFCYLIKDKGFEFISERLGTRRIKVECNKYPFNIKITNKDEFITAKIVYDNNASFLGNCDNIIICNDTIHVIDKSSNVYKLIQVFKNREINEFIFSGDDKNKFLSIIPRINDEGNVKIEEAIVDNYIDTEFKSNIFIDKYENGVSVNIEFIYGEFKFNPFFDKVLNPYIIRDYIKENIIIKLIEDCEFKIFEDKVYLDEDDNIYTFFRDIVSNLVKVADLFYSDEVKNMYLGCIKNYRGSVTSNFDNDLININIDFEDINQDEVKSILKALKERKKYHRLKNGLFLSLEDEENKELTDFIDKIDLEDISDNGISINKYKAINIFSRMEDNNKFQNCQELYALVNKIKDFNTQNIEIPEYFNKTLRPYQFTGYKWLKILTGLNLGGILADDMGLGKTLQAITLIYTERKNGTSIVVTPSSLIYNWENEVNKFAPEIKTLIVSGNRSIREDMINKIEEYDLIITSYPLVRRDIDLYEKYMFNLCIIDEAQNIKNPNSLSCESIKRLNAKNRFALTGTPIENSIVELWSIFDFLMPGFLMDKNKFIDEFERPIVRENDEDVQKELKKIITPFILRRRKSDVLKELPDKIETIQVCELTEEQKSIYDAYLYKIKGDIKESINNKTFNKKRIQVLSYITRLRQICCHPAMFLDNYNGESGKLELLLELVDNLISSQHRILLFSQFTTLLDIVKKKFEQNNIKYLYLDGSTQAYERINLVNRFNAGEGDVFLISLRAGGTGLNLTSADTVIHYDPWWNPAVEEQASDRAHRIGQTNVVEVFKLITKDTIEEKIYKLQLKKKALIDSIIKEGETFINKLSSDEILELFDIH